MRNFGRLLSTRTIAALATGVLLVAAPRSDAAFVPPEWALDGPYEVEVDAGFHSLAGRWRLPIEGVNTTLLLGYDARGRIEGAGVASSPSGIFGYSVVGRYAVDGETGVQSVSLWEPGRRPRFRFEGALEQDGTDLVGTYEVQPGFANATIADSADLSILRQDPAVGPRTFTLRLDVAQSFRGRVAGADTGETTKRGRAILERATLTVFGDTVDGDRVLENGRIRGAVRRLRDGTLRGVATVRGRGWAASLVGPVDEAGFHAVCNVRGGGFRVRGFEATLAVVEGPEAPPPPPPPPPRNLLTGAVARIAGGQMELTHDAVPRRFFNRRARVTVQFPSSTGPATVTADPGTSGGANPIRYFVTIAGATFGTAQEPAAVVLEVRKFSTAVGGTVEVLCTGEVRSASGARRTVDMLLEATVAE